MKMKMTRKKAAIFASGIAAAAAVTLAGCGPHNASAIQRENQQAIQDNQSLINNQPLPHFNWSQYRQTLIDIETIEANGTQTTTFFFNQGDRDPIGSCASLGLPVPNTAQLDNPDQNYNSGYPNGGTSYPIPQMDPNGVYSPNASTGTFVLCVGPGGKPYVHYWEGFVDTYTAPAVWNYSTHQVQLNGPSTFHFSTKH